MMPEANETSCSEILKLLADETRLAVVRQLMDGPKRVGELNEGLQCEPTLLSHHLRTLRDAGVIVGERDGKAILYRLGPSVDVRRNGRVLELGCCRLDFS